MGSIDTPLVDLEILNKISLQEGVLWEFYFLDLPDLSTGFNSLQNTVSSVSSLANTATGLMFYKYLVQETSFSPDRSIDYEYDEPTRKHYPVKASAYGDFSITFRETEQFSAYKFLKGLHNKVLSNEKGMFKSGKPSITGILVFYKKFNAIENKFFDSKPLQNLDEFRRGLASNFKVFDTGQIFVLEDLTLKEIGNLSVSYTSAESVTVTGSFNVSNVKPLGIDTFLGIDSQALSAIGSLL